jgi:hypothetical protein
MLESYAVVWQEEDGPRQVGKLEVDGPGAHLGRGVARDRTGVFVASETITGVEVHIRDPACWMICAPRRSIVPTARGSRSAR